MYVYILIEETDQDDFLNKSGDIADSSSTIVGVYSTAEKAKKEKEIMAEDNDKSVCYIIEERAVL